MPQTTDLFFHTIFFGKFNMLTSLSLHFVANIEGAYTPDNAKGGGVSQIHFSVIIFIFQIVKVYTLEDKVLTKIMEVFILEVNS